MDTKAIKTEVEDQQAMAEIESLSDIAEHEKTRFTEADWRQFFQMMEKPPAPMERMKKAAKKYREISGHHAV